MEMAQSRREFDLWGAAQAHGRTLRGLRTARL